MLRQCHGTSDSAWQRMVSRSMTSSSSQLAAVDIISDLAGVRPGSPLADLRAGRPEAALHAQGSYDALFDPTETGGLSQLERFAVALRVTRLHDSTAAARHFHTRLTQAGAVEEDPEAVASPRLRAMLRHANLLA